MKQLGRGVIQTPRPMDPTIKESGRMADSTDPIAAYSAALNAFREADDLATCLVKLVREEASKLAGDKWKHAQVSNLGLQEPLDLPVQLAINGSTWPTARQLGEALQQWRLAKRALATAWDVVPKKIRSSLEAPP
jgi:hypothetical protein